MMSRLFRITLLLSFFFGVNKLVALVRQGLIAREFGLSPAIDAFNVANNVPDLLFSLISGGALALAFIPVLTEYIDKRGRSDAWLLFSRIANLVFVATAILSILVAIFARQIVSAEFGIAPGFSPQQQQLTARLMQLNLIATLIFSLGGLVMAALQSHKSFVLPAIAPILYNVGQIFGAVILAPYFNLGVYGLAYGVILGAVLHLMVQIPGMIKYGFVWSPTFGWHDEGVRKVLRLMGPRILTVLFIQIIFLTRDNLASRLHEGAVSALTYGYFILQVPETLIGTAIATALLPTLAHFADEKKTEAFADTLHTAIRVVFSISVLITVVLSVGLDSLIGPLFHFSTEASTLLSLTTKAYLVGLFAQCLLEIVTRAYYAQQDSRTPFMITLVRMFLYIGLSIVFLEPWGAVGLAFFDSLTVAFEVGALFYLLSKSMPVLWVVRRTLIRTGASCFGSAAIMYAIMYVFPAPAVISSLAAVVAGSLVGLYFLRDEVRLLIRL